MANLFEFSIDRVIDAAGLASSGAKLYFYFSTTTILATVYTNGVGNIPLPNPVIADSSGNFPAVFLDPAVAYRVRLTDSAGVSLRTDVDPVQISNGGVITTVPDDITPEACGFIGTGDATAAMTVAFATGKNVKLTLGTTYSFTTNMSLSANGQKVYGGGVLKPVGNVGIVVPSGIIGGTLSGLTFNSSTHTGTAIKVLSAGRTFINNINMVDVFSAIYVEGSNTVYVTGVWGTCRGKGITWYGTDTLRSDVLTLNDITIDLGVGNTNYCLDWDGNCNTLIINNAEFIHGHGGIVRNTSGGVNKPAIGRFNVFASDFSGSHGLFIADSLILDIELTACYLQGSTGDGLRVASGVNTGNIRINGGFFVGNSGYGINNLSSGPIYYSGSAQIASNATGTISGNVWSVPNDIRFGNGTRSINVIGANSDLAIAGDSNDYKSYDSAVNAWRTYINSVQVKYEDSSVSSLATKLIAADSSVTAVPSILGQTGPSQAYILGLGDNTGTTLARFSNDNKGTLDWVIKSRGTTIGDLTPVTANDQIYTRLYYGTSVGGGINSIAHAGYVKVAIDGTPRTVAPVTELPSLYYIGTCTGTQAGGNRVAIALSSEQKVWLPGPLSAPPGPGTAYGGILNLGIGSTAANSAPIKFTLASTALMTSPEAGAFETDSTGNLYVTNSSAVRSKIVTADTGNMTIAAGTGAGTTPTISITNASNGGRITLTTGTAPTLGGVIATITYPNAFATDSFVIFTPANANAATAYKQVFADGTTANFVLTNQLLAMTAATQYIWNFQIIGK